MIEARARIERARRLAAAPDAAWALLRDVPRWGRLFPHAMLASPAPIGKPAIKYQRHKSPPSPDLMEDTAPHTMPLMPVIRPKVYIMPTAVSPTSTPPIIGFIKVCINSLITYLTTT